MTKSYKLETEEVFKIQPVSDLERLNSVESTNSIYDVVVEERSIDYMKDGPFVGMGPEEIYYFANTRFWKTLRIVAVVFIFLVWAALVATCVVVIIIYPRCRPAPILKWWQNDLVYQIYPSTFQDTNDDGIGDLNGVTKRLNYVKSLGFKTIYINSFYSTSGIDGGYDITNHTNVASQYGTIDDFKELMIQAKIQDIKVLIDFVPNHSSNQHSWFTKSRERTFPYEDYYIWASCGNNGTELPNNWKSASQQSAWTYDEIRQQCYYHAFLKEQPDLNWRNPLLVQDMMNILRFWMDQGVSGFRISEISYLFEDYLLRNETSEKSFRNNLQETIEMTKQITYFIKTYEIYNRSEPRFSIVVPSGSLETAMKYYHYQNCPTADMPMNIFLAKNVKNKPSLDSCDTALCIWKYIRDWNSSIPNPVDTAPNFLLTTHDFSRMLTRWGSLYSKAFNMLLLTLPGTRFVYYGEELGMIDLPLNLIPENMRDQRYNESRWTARSPMQWNGDFKRNAGFSNVTNSTQLFLPINQYNLSTINVESQTTITNSDIQFFRAMIEQIDYPNFSGGDFLEITADNSIISYMRLMDGVTRFLIAINFGNRTVVNLDLKKFVPQSEDKEIQNAKIRLSSSWTDYQVNPDVYPKENLSNMQLEPGEAKLIGWPYPVKEYF